MKKRLTRERFDKKIAGVCGGWAQYLSLDSAIIRLICIILTILTGGLFIIFYLLCWLILPLGPKAYVQASYKRLYRSPTNRMFGGICGGLAEYFHIDANILRIIIAILFFITGVLPILVAYLIGLIVIPLKPSR